MGRDGTGILGRDGTGRDRTDGTDGMRWDGTGRDGTGRDGLGLFWFSSHLHKHRQVSFGEYIYANYSVHKIITIYGNRMKNC